IFGFVHCGIGVL
ncbi:hypothetical protein D030_2967B, partial [Vibrio parahaemolyticus AQ3810]